MVYVLSKDNKPLMPCTNVIARLLLKQGKAKVKKREPFTIKLTYDTTEYTQSLTLGVDTGSGTLGAAVSTNDGKIVYMSKVIVRNDITDKMTQRASYRRNRRNRKTRYRKARWLNRRNSIKKDRFSPTMISKLNSHIKEIEYIKSILLISMLVLETATFDCHLMKNPALADEKVKHWGYQQGANYGFEDTKARVLNRDSYKCQICKGKHKDSKLEVHHIVYRSQGGSDEADNLITLCHTCHSALHAGRIKVNFGGKAKGQLKYATQMNSVRCQLLKRYSRATETFGYVTKANRLALKGIVKDHHLDACVIASEGKQPLFATNYVYIKKSVSKGDYQQTKGIRSQQKIPTGKIRGFRKFDKVKYFGKEYFIQGRMSSGYAILMNARGNKIDFSSMPKGFKTPKLNNLTRLSARDTVLVSTAIA